MAGLASALSVVLIAGCARSDDICIVRTFDGSRFSVCFYDPGTCDLRLVQADDHGVALRDFTRLTAYLGPRAKSVRFAMNAGMFDASGTPIGLYIEDGVARHPLNSGDGDGNFYLKPNGVFFVAADGRAGIETSEAFASRASPPLWATQSGPMLVIDGAFNPHISPNGTSTYVRNAVGVHKDGTAVFIISEEPVSFGRLARFLRDGLNCTDALYLDGAVSSLWVPSQNRRDDRAKLGPMIVVTEAAR